MKTEQNPLTDYDQEYFLLKEYINQFILSLDDTPGLPHIVKDVLSRAFRCAWILNKHRNSSDYKSVWKSREKEFSMEIVNYIAAFSFSSNPKLQQWSLSFLFNLTQINSIWIKSLIPCISPLLESPNVYSVIFAIKKGVNILLNYIFRFLMNYDRQNTANTVHFIPGSISSKKSCLISPQSKELIKSSISGLLNCIPVVFSLISTEKCQLNTDVRYPCSIRIEKLTGGSTSTQILLFQNCVDFLTDFYSFIKFIKHIEKIDPENIQSIHNALEMTRNIFISLLLNPVLPSSKTFLFLLSRNIISGSLPSIIIFEGITTLLLEFSIRKYVFPFFLAPLSFVACILSPLNKCRHRNTKKVDILNSFTSNTSTIISKLLHYFLESYSNTAIPKHYCCKRVRKTLVFNFLKQMLRVLSDSRSDIVLDSMATEFFVLVNNPEHRIPITSLKSVATLLKNNNKLNRTIISKSIQEPNESEYSHEYYSLQKNSGLHDHTNNIIRLAIMMDCNRYNIIDSATYLDAVSWISSTKSSEDIVGMIMNNFIEHPLISPDYLFTEESRLKSYQLSETAETKFFREIWRISENEVKSRNPFYNKSVNNLPLRLPTMLATTVTPETESEAINNKINWRIPNEKYSNPYEVNIQDGIGIISLIKEEEQPIIDTNDHNSVDSALDSNLFNNKSYIQHLSGLASIKKFIHSPKKKPITLEYSRLMQILYLNEIIKMTTINYSPVNKNKFWRNLSIIESDYVILEKISLKIIQKALLSNSFMDLSYIEYTWKHVLKVYLDIINFLDFVKHEHVYIKCVNVSLDFIYGVFLKVLRSYHENKKNNKNLDINLVDMLESPHISIDGPGYKQFIEEMIFFKNCTPENILEKDDSFLYKNTGLRDTSVKVYSENNTSYGIYNKFYNIVLFSVFSESENKRINSTDIAKMWKLKNESNYYYLKKFMIDSPYITCNSLKLLWQSSYQDDSTLATKLLFEILKYILNNKFGYTITKKNAFILLLVMSCCNRQDICNDALKLIESNILNIPKKFSTVSCYSTLKLDYKDVITFQFNSLYTDSDWDDMTNVSNWLKYISTFMFLYTIGNNCNCDFINDFLEKYNRHEFIHLTINILMIIIKESLSQGDAFNKEYYIERFAHLFNICCIYNPNLIQYIFLSLKKISHSELSEEITRIIIKQFNNILINMPDHRLKELFYLFSLKDPYFHNLHLSLLLRIVEYLKTDVCFNDEFVTEIQSIANDLFDSYENFDFILPVLTNISENQLPYYVEKLLGKADSSSIEKFFNKSLSLILELDSQNCISHRWKLENFLNLLFNYAENQNTHNIPFRKIVEALDILVSSLNDEKYSHISLGLLTYMEEHVKTFCNSKVSSDQDTMRKLPKLFGKLLLLSVIKIRTLNSQILTNILQPLLNYSGNIDVTVETEKKPVWEDNITWIGISSTIYQLWLLLKSEKEKFLLQEIIIKLPRKFFEEIYQMLQRTSNSTTDQFRSFIRTLQLREMNITNLDKFRHYLNILYTFNNTPYVEVVKLKLSEDIKLIILHTFYCILILNNNDENPVYMKTMPFFQSSKSFFLSLLQLFEIEQNKEANIVLNYIDLLIKEESMKDKIQNGNHLVTVENFEDPDTSEITDTIESAENFENNINNKQIFLTYSTLSEDKCFIFLKSKLRLVQNEYESGSDELKILIEYAVNYIITYFDSNSLLFNIDSNNETHGKNTSKGNVANKQSTLSCIIDNSNLDYSIHAENGSINHVQEEYDLQLSRDSNDNIYSNTTHIHVFSLEYSANDFNCKLFYPVYTIRFYVTLLRNLMIQCILYGHLDSILLLNYKKLCKNFEIPFDFFLLSVESKIALQLDFDKVAICRKESTKNQLFKAMKIAAVATSLGGLTALTAGLAAPAIASGITVLGIAGTASITSFISSIPGCATLASIMGAGTASLSSWKYSRRLGKIKVFQFDKLEPLFNCVEKSCISDSNKNELNDNDRASISELPNLLLSASITENVLRQSIICEIPVIEKYSDSSNNTFEIEHGKYLRKYSKCLENHDFISYIGFPIKKKPITMTLCVSGWLSDFNSIWSPWELLTYYGDDVYALRWEPDILNELGSFLINMLSETVAINAASVWLQTTIAGALSSALMWPVSLIHYASNLDNAWTTCKEKAIKAGKLLAWTIHNKKETLRPINLIGYSMGALLILTCLFELYHLERYNIISNVILLGTPFSTAKSKWQKARLVVADRLVNINCKNDWLLSFLFRYMEWGIKVAGLSSVKVKGVENYDVSTIVSNHGDYANKIANILDYINYFPVPNKS